MYSRLPEPYHAALLVCSVVRHPYPGAALLSAAASVGLGSATGAILSLGTGRIGTRWIENGTHDPLVVLGVLVLVVAVSALAYVVPALRALRVDPMAALRCE
jgi:ABC-type antimicrobial peptide transport system permease subunit